MVTALARRGYPIVEDRATRARSTLYGKPPGPVTPLLGIEVTSDVATLRVWRPGRSATDPHRRSREVLASALAAMSRDIHRDVLDTMEAALARACLMLLDPDLAVLEGVRQPQRRGLIDALMGHVVPSVEVPVPAVRPLAGSPRHARQVDDGRNEIFVVSRGTAIVLVTCDHLDGATAIIWPNRAVPRPVFDALRDAVTAARSEPRHSRLAMLKQALDTATSMLPLVATGT
jgi:hypothetical protein